MPKSLILDETDLNFLVLAMSLFRNNIKALCSEDPDVEGMFRLDEDLRTAQSKAYAALGGETDEPCFWRFFVSTKNGGAVPFTDAELRAAEHALSTVRSRIKELLPDENLEVWAQNAAGWRHVHGLIIRHFA